MNSSKNRQRAGVVVGVGALMLGGGVAWAAWTNTGTGAASAQAATASNLIVTAGSPVAALFPQPTGGYGSTTVGAVYTTVANPNPYPVTITTATIGSISVTPASGLVCAASNVAATAASVPLASPVVVPAKSTASPTAVTIPNAIYMVNSAPDGCQGATVSTTVTLSGASS